MEPPSADGRQTDISGVSSMLCGFQQAKLVSFHYPTWFIGARILQKNNYDSSTIISYNCLLYKSRLAINCVLPY